jgi:hypothetical protein
MESALPQLIVPIYDSKSDAIVIMTGRTPTGQPVGIAFTDVEHLINAMGRSQAWMHLSEVGLRGMLAPLGFRRIQVDPLLVGPEVPSAPALATEPAPLAEHDRAVPVPLSPRLRPTPAAGASQPLHQVE